MNRTAWLQDRRMQKFRDVLSRWERKELSALEAGELLGCSERQSGAIGFAMKRTGLPGSSIAGWAGPRLGGCRWTGSPGCWRSIAPDIWAGR
jgi:hypothetical protein